MSARRRYGGPGRYLEEIGRPASPQSYEPLLDSGDSVSRIWAAKSRDVAQAFLTCNNPALVIYALDGMGNALFVSRYQPELPRREELEKLLEEELRERGTGEVGA
jgi:hypothetical protein